jgi:hypothetical protein
VSFIMSQSQKSPLARLVLFMICLSIAGGFVAGVHYFAIDLPQQQKVQAPHNGSWVDIDGLTRCNNLYLSRQIDEATWHACRQTCCSPDKGC